MIAVQSYLYDNIVSVQILDPAIFKNRNRTVYNRPIKIYKGIDNPILVQIKNQDQKLVNLDGKSIFVELQDTVDNISVLEYETSLSTASNGDANFIFYKSDIEELKNRYYKLALKIVDDLTGSERPLYSDDYFGLSLDVEVLPGFNTTKN
jgi:hypothetical protein